MTFKTSKPASSSSHAAVLTRLAFLIAIAAAVARCTLMEILRNPFEVTPGVKPYARGPGPAESVAIDLICCLPAILLLLRRMLDKTFSLRLNCSHFLLLLLAAWMALSLRWADDKFATLISTANFVAALALLWSASQLVRGWMRLRVVAAAAYALLLVSLAQGFYYKFVDGPDLVNNYLQNKKQILADRGFAPDSFEAKQFETKILSSELFGWSDSANSFAALVVMLMTIGVGVAIQRLIDGDSPAWAIALALAAPLAVWLLYYTKSKAALVSPILAIALLGLIWKFRPRLAQFSDRLYWVGVSVVLLAVAAVIGHGLAHGSLPTASLNFRWRYWVAAWSMFERHPFRGVGWDNFYLHYLRDRLPAAAEEIRDPHNFIIRFFVELGLVGGFLLVAWMLRLWWEMTRPSEPPAASQSSALLPRPGRIAWLAGIALAVIAIHILFGVDFLQDYNFLIIEGMKCFMYLCAIVIGLMIVSTRSLEKPQIDDRPAPWILYGLLVAIGVFLIHNLIEFSLFEPGLLCLFGLLAGSALGIRQAGAEAPRRGNLFPGIALAAVLTACVAAVIWILIPTARAQLAEYRGDEALRTGNFEQASAEYQTAWADQPLNAQYPFLAARALHLEAFKTHPIPDSQRDKILSLYALSIDHNPSAVNPYLWRAGFAGMIGDHSRVIRDYRTALELNPNEVSIRLDFAQALKSMNKIETAHEQMAIALKYNDQLDAAEPKRLSSDKVRSIQNEIDQAPTTAPAH